MEVFGLAHELRVDGQAFALATVTWRRGPSSGKSGSRAVILPDGTVIGWLGGACAEPTVVREALAALVDGRSRLLALGEADPRPGVTEVAMACSSEGAMEVFVEPFLPVPHVLVVGDSPMVGTLGTMVDALGWTSSLVVDAGVVADAPTGSFVVVATQGHFDEPAVAAALTTKAAWVGLVASEKRASTVREWLRAEGVSDADLARLRAPAGLDLGPTTHEEIAVAILAELVAFRASEVVPTAVAVAEPETAIDPVCHMTVDIATARFVSRQPGGAVYFCAAGCQRSYDADPAAFA